jgi:threonine 3-dehydrogenase
MAVAIARHAGARNVVATDMNPYRLALAEKMGANRVMDVSGETLQEVQKELGMQEGFDVGLEMSGSGLALNDMIDNMAHGGKIALLGIPAKDLAVDWNTIIFNMITIKGIYGREMYETWYMMTAMIQSGLDITPIITHRFHYTDFREAFDLMESGNSGKIILDWE